MIKKESDEKQWGWRWVAIVNDAEIDIIWEKYAAESERLRRIMGGVK